MNPRVKIAAASILPNSVLFAILFVRQRKTLPALEGTEALARSWGLFIVLLIAGFVALNVLTVLVVTGLDRRGGGGGFQEPVDERDRMIEHRAVHAFALVLSFGPLLFMAALAAGFGLDVSFTVLAFFILLSGVALNATYIARYTRG